MAVTTPLFWFDVDVETADGPGAVVRLHGTPDLHGADQLRRCLVGLVAGGARNLVLDLDGLRRLHPAAARAISLAARRLRADGNVRVVNAPAPARQVLCALGASRVVDTA